MLVGAACGGGDESAAPATTTSTQVAAGEVKAPPVAPLTGRPDKDGVAQGRPALAVKIDNAPKARPQAGLDVADIVIEEVVEGGATRFFAVFQSQAPDLVGPIRSVRPMDPQIVSALGGLVAYSGGIPEFVRLMRGTDAVQDLSYDNLPSAYQRDGSKRAPHNLMASPQKLWAAADGDHKAPPAPFFAYRAPNAAFGGSPAEGVAIRYSDLVDATYSWDASAQAWLRSYGDTPHMAASGARVAAENLVVQFVQTKTLGYTDQSGTKVTESIVTGQGEAIMFSGGQMVKGRWSKAQANGPTTFTDADGKPVKLAPGRTWIHLVPAGADVNVVAPAIP